MSYIYGLLKTAIETLLLMVYKVTGNFGIAIIGATIIIKIILLPLTLKQDKSMKNMKKLQPEMEKIKEQYKNDPNNKKQWSYIKNIKLTLLEDVYHYLFNFLFYGHYLEF